MCLGTAVKDKGYRSEPLKQFGLGTAVKDKGYFREIQHGYRYEMSNAEIIQSGTQAE